jgi:hypothetical protein
MGTSSMTYFIDGDSPVQHFLQLAYQGEADARPALIDLRDPSLFMISRLNGAYSVPLDHLVARMVGILRFFAE